MIGRRSSSASIEKKPGDAKECVSRFLTLKFRRAQCERSDYRLPSGLIVTEERPLSYENLFSSLSATSSQQRLPCSAATDVAAGHRLARTGKTA
jgi:hypothetical protein